MKISEKVHDYISETSNYDIDELMEELVCDIPEMRPHGKYTNPVSLDECGVYWGDDHYLIGLDDYTRQMFKSAVERVLNVVKSFEEEQNV